MSASSLIASLDPIRDSGHWGYMGDKWYEIIGDFNIDNELPTFYVYYRVETPQGMVLSKHATTKHDFIYCTPEEMQEKYLLLVEDRYSRLSL